MAPTDTRRRILDAALTCFLQDGYEQTTTARVRERSGVSNGALFHHFPSKEAIAGALYVDAIGSFQEGLWQLLDNRPRSLRSALRATIEHQLRWTEEHPDLARFVYMRGHLDWDSPAGAAVVTRNRELAAAFREWMAPLRDRGAIRPMSMLLVSAIVSGPAHSLAQRWLAGMLDASLAGFVDELTDAAWAALRGKPLPARAPAPPLAQGGRVTLELVSEDGRVLAQGHASATLVPVEPHQPEAREPRYTKGTRS
jgi:AcrR family transcriptional regulator